MTGRAVANPLQALLAAAAKNPRVTGETGKYQARIDSAGSAHLVLCDVSGSMQESAGGGRRRIDHLREALAVVLRPDHALMAFATGATWINSAAELPEPSGGTALELALALAATREPAATLVISDGQPNQPALALDVAKRVPGIINVLYCGPDNDADALAFMRQLARTGLGQCHMHRWSASAGQPSLAQSMRLLLTAR